LYSQNIPEIMWNNEINALKQQNWRGPRFYFVLISIIPKCCMLSTI